MTDQPEGLIENRAQIFGVTVQGVRHGKSRATP
jgi:hypothetical protein